MCNIKLYLLYSLFYFILFSSHYTDRIVCCGTNVRVDATILNAHQPTVLITYRIVNGLEKKKKSIVADRP